MTQRQVRCSTASTQMSRSAHYYNLWQQNTVWQQKWDMTIFLLAGVKSLSCFSIIKLSDDSAESFALASTQIPWIMAAVAILNVSQSRHPRCHTKRHISEGIDLAHQRHGLRQRRHCWRRHCGSRCGRKSLKWWQSGNRGKCAHCICSTEFPLFLFLKIRIMCA